MNRLILMLPLIAWLLIISVEWGSYFSQRYPPVYFRAWEYVLNQGDDSYYLPFQPLSRYEGKMEGDLLNQARLLSLEKRKQVFQVDEYGFRNMPGLLNKPIKAVVAGTSFVGGAQETQGQLISTLLADIYGIPTYNYATLPLQHFWEDERFIKNKPEYVITVANEIEIIGGSWVEKIEPSSSTHTVSSWKSNEEWKNAHMPQIRSLDDLIKSAKSFSLSRYYANKAWLQFINMILPPHTVVNLFGTNVSYQTSNKMLFLDMDSNDTIYSPPVKEKIKKEIAVLKKTQKLLSDRDIQYIIVVVPSKQSLYGDAYKNIPTDKKSLIQLEKAMKEAGIVHIPLLNEMQKKVQEDSIRYYYTDDGHWSSEVNLLVSEKLAKLMNVE